MNLGQIKADVRRKFGSTTGTYLSDPILQNYCNDAHLQLSMDVDHPQATQYFSTIPQPAQPALAVVGPAGTTSVQYWVIGVSTLAGGGDSVPSPAASLTTAPAELTSTNYVTISFASTPGTTYRIARMFASESFPSLLTSVTATGPTTTVNDQGAFTPQAYQFARGNEWQLPQLVKIQRAYILDPSGSQQPLVPTDYNAILGIYDESWNQASGLVQGNPTNSPMALAQQPTPYPVQSPITGRVPVGVPWCSSYGYFQRPVYYLRGGSSGYFGVLPPPLGTNLVVLDYIPKPPVLQQNADLSLFPDAFIDAISYKMLEYISLMAKDGNAGDYHARYMEECARLRSAYVENLQGDKPAYLSPMTLRTEFRSWPV